MKIALIQFPLIETNGCLTIDSKKNATHHDKLAYAKISRIEISDQIGCSNRPQES